MVKTRDIDVSKVAKLANLSVSSQEEKIYTEQLSRVVQYINNLNDVETSDVEPTYNTTGSVSVKRKDEAGASLTQKEAMVNAASKRNGLFVTKGVFEE